MTVQSRRRRIEEIAHAEAEVSFEALAAEFGVSQMTIRRDVEHLEAKGVIRKILGGVISVKGTSVEPSFAARAAGHSTAKEMIARATVALLEPQETVLLDSGSTALAVAREIRGKDLRLTVLTPSVLAALELVDEPDTTVIMTGGVLRPGELSLIGGQPEAVYAQYNCDTYVMGVGGLDADRGATEYHVLEGAVKQAGVRCAERVICVVDKAKLGKVRLVTVAPLSRISVIVTDAAPESPTLQTATNAGVRVVFVDSVHANATSTDKEDL